MKLQARFPSAERATRSLSFAASRGRNSGHLYSSFIIHAALASKELEFEQYRVCTIRQLAEEATPITPSTPLARAAKGGDAPLGASSRNTTCGIARRSCSPRCIKQPVSYPYRDGTPTSLCVLEHGQDVQLLQGSCVA